MREVAASISLLALVTTFTLLFLDCEFKVIGLAGIQPL